MKYHEYVARATQEAFVSAFNYAKAVPADKVDWKPLDAGRSVLDQCRELARCPVWAVSILRKEPQDWSEEAMAKEEAICSSYATVEDCERVCGEELQRFYACIAEIPEEQLAETMFLPFGGGRDYPFHELMDYPRWNLTYHLGQIAYIQSLYGDKKMY